MFSRRHTYNSDKLLVAFWCGINLINILSICVEYPNQSAFLRLKRLLYGVGCGTITGFTETHIGRCWVWGTGSRIDFPHMFPMHVEANMRSGLYPFFHLALMNDFGSLASRISDRLLDSAHCSTASPSVLVV